MYVKTLDGEPKIATAEIPLNFNKITNGGGLNAEHFTTVISSDNYYVCSGYSNSDLSSLTGGAASEGVYDFVIAKFNKSDLSLVSINNLGGTGSDYFESIIESDNYYIAVGSSESDLSTLTGGTASVGNSDFIIAKINKSDLSLQSINNLGGTGNDRLYSLTEYSSYYVAVGKSASNLSALTGGSAASSLEDFVIAKFNKSDLSLVCLNNFGEGFNNSVFNSVIASDGYYIAAGESNADLSGFTGGANTQGSYDYVIAKFNESDLSLATLNNFGDASGNYLNSIKESGDYYVCAGSSFSGSSDSALVKINKADLSMNSIYTSGWSFGDYFYDIIESGNYYITAGKATGDLSSYPGGENTQGGDDCVIAKFAKSDLALIKVLNFGGSSADLICSIIESDNHYITAGYSASDLSALTGGTTNEGSNDFTIIKIGD